MAVIREFTEDMRAKLKEANESVKGTLKYTKYYMAWEFKLNGKKNWRFGSYNVPDAYTNCYVKSITCAGENRMYIMRESADCVERWLVTDEVKELLGL